MNPFGTDAETVRYAADQVPLPSLAIQLRRIAEGLHSQPQLTEEDRRQMVFALERQATSLEAHADELARNRDYSAEFPAADAEMLRLAIQFFQPAKRK